MMDMVASISQRTDAPELGDTLLRLGILEPIQLAYARQKQAVTGESLNQILVRLGLVADSDLARVLAEYHGLPYISQEEWHPKLQ